jgi:hypothetical protein
MATMPMRFSQGMGLLLALVAGMAFFMPWARLEPNAPAELVRRLATEPDSWAGAYLGLRPYELHAMLAHPADGATGYQLVKAWHAEGPAGAVARSLAQMFWGAATGMWRLQAVWVPLGLVALGAAALLWKKPPGWALPGLAGACLAVYGYARWRLQATFESRLLLQVELGTGLWLTLYVLLLMGLLLAVRALLPAKWKF